LFGKAAGHCALFSAQDVLVGQRKTSTSESFTGVAEQGKQVCGIFGPGPGLVAHLVMAKPVLQHMQQVPGFHPPGCSSAGFLRMRPGLFFGRAWCLGRFIATCRATVLPCSSSRFHTLSAGVTKCRNLIALLVSGRWERCAQRCVEMLPSRIIKRFCARYSSMASKILRASLSASRRGRHFSAAPQPAPTPG
jgi:hypothetical protein